MKHIPWIGLLSLSLLLPACGDKSDDKETLGQPSAVVQGGCQISPARLQFHHGKPVAYNVKVPGESVPPEFVQMYMQWNYPANWGGLIFASDTQPFDKYTERRGAARDVLQLQTVFSPREVDMANAETRALQSPVPILNGVVLRTASGKVVACEVPAEVMP